MGELAVPQGVKEGYLDFILAALYLIPIGLCIHWRIQHRPSKSNFWGITFVVLMLVGCLTRIPSWCAQPFLEQLSITKTANFYWNMIPSIIFSSNYVVILFMWMETFHTEVGGQKISLIPVYLYMSVVLYVAVFALLTADLILLPPRQKPTDFTCISPSTPIQKALNGADAFIYFVTSLLFLAYGGGFYFHFSEWGGGKGPLLNKMKTAILPRVKILTVLFTSCFIARGILCIISTFSQPSMNCEQWVVFAYYASLEVFPIILMLLVLHPTSQQNENQPPSNSIQGGQSNYETISKA